MTSPDDIKFLYNKTIDGNSYNMNCLKVHHIDEMISISHNDYVQGTITLPFTNALGVVGFAVSGTGSSFCTFADAVIIGADKDTVRYMVRNRQASGGSRTWTLYFDILYYDASIYTVANTYTDENSYAPPTSTYEKNFALGADSAGVNQIKVYEGSLTFSPNPYYEAVINLPMECPLGVISRDFDDVTSASLGIYRCETDIDPDGVHLRMFVRTYSGTPYPSVTLNYKVLYLAHPYDIDEIHTSN